MVKSLLPRMHGLCVLVTETSILSRTASITEFQQMLRTLSTNLEQALSAEPAAHFLPPLISPNQTSGMQDRAATNSVSMQSTSRSGKRPLASNSLLPPSPEARQKRKISHGIM